jgi:hypothetical protein
MPSRDDIDPSEIGEYLGWVCLLEILPSGEDFRLRLVGRALGQYFAHDVNGLTVTEALAPAGTKSARAVLGYAMTAVEKTCVVRAFGDCSFSRPQQPQEFETLFLPLSDDGVHVNMLLGVFAFERSQTLPAVAAA